MVLVNFSKIKCIFPTFFLRLFIHENLLQRDNFTVLQKYISDEQKLKVSDFDQLLIEFRLFITEIVFDFFIRKFSSKRESKKKCLL